MTADTKKSGVMSFRDPSGSLIRWESRILRAVHGEGRSELDGFLKSRIARELLDAKRLVTTTELRGALGDGHLRSLLALGDAVSLYEHSPVWFPSYPYEWPAEMLYAAAEVTLDIAEAALDEGFGLKDATPFNILFENGRAVFVDVCSFEKRKPTDPIWLACGQFERMFLLPLLVNRQLGMGPRLSFAGNLDGLDADALGQWFSFPKNLHPAVLRMVTIPHLLNRIAESEIVRKQLHTKREVSVAAAGKLLRGLLFGLRQKLSMVAPRSRGSAWSDYAPDPDEVAVKTRVVTRVLEGIGAKSVLDVGCNTGTYSKLAASKGASVVALDADPAVVGRVWLEASRDGLDILPLTVNFSRPTPGMGWRNAEYQSFEARAKGKFDCILMLAVLHHIVVNERIPLPQLFETAAGYTRKSLVIEFVANNDPMFERISRGRESLFANHTEKAFLAAAEPWFLVVERTVVSETRALFILQKR